MNEKKKRKAQKNHKSSSYDIIQKKVKMEEDKQSEEQKCYKQIQDQFQQAQCCVHFDNLCLISDLAINNKIYQCSKHVHPGQYYCQQTYDQLLKQHGRYNLKCSLCSEKHGMTKIDLISRKFLSQFLLKCKKCLQHINSLNLTNHLIENINYSIENHQEFQLNFEKIDFKVFQHYQLFIQETSKIDMRNQNNKQIIAILNTQIEKHLQNEGFQVFFSESEVQTQILGNGQGLFKMNCVQIKINKKFFIQLMKLEKIDKTKNQCKQCKDRNTGHLRTGIREEYISISSENSETSSQSDSANGSPQQLFSDEDSSSSSYQSFSPELSLRRIRSSLSRDRRYRRSHSLERRIRSSYSSERSGEIRVNQIINSSLIRIRSENHSIMDGYNEEQQARNDVQSPPLSPVQINRSNVLDQQENIDSYDLSD